MSHRFVRYGTPIHDGPSLCESCRYATVVRGLKLDDEIVECAELNRPHNRIVFKVRACNSYKNKAEPTLDMLREIAWELRTDHSGKRIGFMSPLDAQALVKKGAVQKLDTVRDPFRHNDY